MIVYNAAGDPIGRLSEYLDALDDHIHVADRQVRREQRNRLSLLHLHALAGMLIGPTFAAIGTEGMRAPIWLVVRLIPGTPYSLAALMFAGALVLGASTTVRNLRWEIIGLTMLLSWYTIIAVSFAIAIVVWVIEGRPAEAGPPSLYAPFVYAHLAAVMCVHLYTLRKMRRARKWAL